MRLTRINTESAYQNPKFFPIFAAKFLDDLLNEFIYGSRFKS